MKQFNVTGMTCAACSARVEKAVAGVAGVESCSVSLLTNSMGVEGNASDEAIIKAVTEAGYGASVKSGGRKGGKDSDEGALKDMETPVLAKRLASSIVFLVPLMYFSMGHMMWGWPLPQFFDGNHVAMGLVQLILSAVITPWDNNVTEWSYDVDADHAYMFFQLAYPGKLTAYRLTLRGIAFEAYDGGGSGEDTAPTGDLAAKLVVEVAGSDAANAEWTQLGEPLVLPDARRLYCKFVRSYEGATPVFVRTRIINNVGRAGIFNIYLAYQGEESKRIIQEQMVGIDDVQPAVSLPAGIYSVSGVRRNELRRGLNIIVTSDGNVKKVLVK